MREKRGQNRFQTSRVLERRGPPRRIVLSPFFALALVEAFFTTPALAHRINMIALVQGTAIAGEAYFADGSPARGATVTVLDPAGKPLGQTTTDSHGRFSFPLHLRCDHRVVVDAGDGHAKAVTVPASEIPATLPAWEGKVPASANDAAATAPSGTGGELAAQLAALQGQLAELRMAQDRHENQVRLHDVLGGIGWILGLMGLAFYFLGVRRKEKAECRKPAPAKPVAEGMTQ
jgi:nickel transport protein